MGADPYWYYTKYETDLNAALQKLRLREFQAGRYNPVIQLLDFPVTENSPAPGAQHSSIEEALVASDADGTRSILDIHRVVNEPFPLTHEEFDEALLGGSNPEILGEIFCTSFALSSSELKALFGTAKPTHQEVEDGVSTLSFWELMERGTGRHVIVYEEDQPSEIFFAGYSFD
jgi:hypothetical protein